MVVAGGGGGGFGSLGGGGGAGEVLVSGLAILDAGKTVTNTSTIPTTPGDVTFVAIGAGGISGAPLGTAANAGQDAQWRPGGNGNNSSFGAFFALGGGGGGGTNGGTAGLNGANGGSGGGAANTGYKGLAINNVPPTGWTSFKNNGSDAARGGGGGAGSPGISGGTGQVIGSGQGITVWGIKVAGGGLGWQRFGQDSSLGGNGRSGSAGYPFYGSPYSSAGKDGTGTGGGAGAPGGSGLVVIRYATIVG